MTGTKILSTQTTADHRETLKVNGWDFCAVDILDEEGAAMIPVTGGKHFTEMSEGKHLLGYDSLVVLTHFKGHAMGGLGGSMKNTAIGCADGRIGKKMVHAAPDNEDYKTWLMGEPFQENMVESAKAIIDHFGERTVEAFRGFLDCLDGAREKGIVYGTGAWGIGEIEGSRAMKEAYELGKSI